MKNRKYTYTLVFTGGGCGEWRIHRLNNHGYLSVSCMDEYVWSCPHKPEHDDGSGEPPIELRTEYERLLRESGWHPLAEEEPFHLVAALADPDGCGFDQPCAYGYRVEDHAVYCYNRNWLYAPGKCRRNNGNSAWGDKAWPHKDCPGFKANPLVPAQGLPQ